MRIFTPEQEAKLAEIQAFGEKLELQQRIRELEEENRELKKENGRYETLYGIVVLILFLLVYAIASTMDYADAVH